MRLFVLHRAVLCCATFLCATAWPSLPRLPAQPAKQLGIAGLLKG